MVRRLSNKPLLYTLFALITLIMCWESGLTNAAVLNQDIPEQAIRLRILANSDAPEDQWVKLKIRDEVVKRMQSWVDQPKDIEEARVMVRAHLDEFDKLVGDILHTYGFSTKRKVELAVVPFPTKVYGNKVYPAGDYEALRITLGNGEGQNWWCVLFPPLCFVDLVGGQKVSQEPPVVNLGSRSAAASAAQAESNANDRSAGNEAKIDSDSASSEGQFIADEPEEAGNEPQAAEVRFFFWDKMVSTFNSLRHFF